MKNKVVHGTLPVADLGGRPPRPKIFSRFHSVFRKIWQNHMLTPLEGWRPLLRGILDPPLIALAFLLLVHYLVPSFTQVSLIHYYWPDNEVGGR